ncbi:MAG: protein kinase, partial [Planctomycetes bacterium]|nr:protein kinase [Planctomycetota bacterium]
MLELPPQVIQALLDAGVPRDDVIAAWSSLSGSARHGLGLARRLLEMGAAQPAQLERALGAAPRPAQPLRQFAGYEVLRPLGRGAMGQVHLVRDAQGRSFALKTLAEVDEPVLIQRFQREVRTMCALSHPHLARIHDAGVLGRTPYLVMDLYPGGSLQEHLARGPLEPEVARGIAWKLASALEAVHAQGL